MSNSATHTRPNGADFSDAKKDIQEAAVKAKDAAYKARDAASDSVHELRESARETAEKAKETGRRYAEQGNEMLFDARVEAEDVVRRNPGLAVAGALGVGVLIGLALKTRR